MIAEVFRSAAQAAATLVEAIGALIVVVAVIVIAARYAVGSVIQRRPMPSETLRLRLGSSLALSLEFLLGADILRTAVEPSWDELGRLAAIAAIRRVLNFFLQREIARDAVVPNAHLLPARQADLSVRAFGNVLRCI